MTGISTSGHRGGSRGCVRAGGHLVPATWYVCHHVVPGTPLIRYDSIETFSQFRWHANFGRL